MRHFDTAGDEFSGTTRLGEHDGEPALIFQMGEDKKNVANVTFTLRLGALTPVAARELRESLDEAPPLFLEYLSQYYFDIYGKDISDPM